MKLANLFKITTILLTVVLSVSCGTSSKHQSNTMKKNNLELSERNKQSSPDGKTILYAEIVQHEFTTKGARGTGIMEYYLRCSVQDYFIKFCESAVTETEIATYFNAERMMNPITIEAEIRDGSWDMCDDVQVQSRTGEYVVIKAIVKK